MSRFVNALKADVKFQFRQGFYFVYLLLVIVYIAVIFQVGPKAAVIVVPVIIFFDPSFVGFFFIGGLVLLERQQGITGYLGITPVTTGEYMWSKMISMAVLALVSSIGLAALSGISFNIPVLIVGVILSSLFFTLIGFLSVASCRTMNEYFFRMIPYILMITLSAIGLLDKPWAILFRFTPTFAGLRMILDAFNGVNAGRSLLDTAVLISWCAVLYIPVKNRFEKKAIRGE